MPEFPESRGSEFPEPTPIGTEYHVGYGRIRPQRLDADCSDHSARRDVLLREEPDEQEDDDEENEVREITMGTKATRSDRPSLPRVLFCNQSD